MTENKEPIIQVTMHKKVKIVDDEKNTELHYACARGNLEEVLEQLGQIHTIDVENYLGWTPLMMACRRGHIAIVETLLKQRADATRKNKFGFSVFLMCVASGNLQLVKLILQHLLSGGISRNSIQKIFSPLSLAVLFNHEEILYYLINQRFNIDAATHITGITPLMFASALRRCNLYTALTNLNANSGLKNLLGCTAEDLKTFKIKKAPPVKITVNGDNCNCHVPAPVPMMLVNASPSPVFHYSPLQSNPNFLHPQFTRKSSNVSPQFIMSPNITPIHPPIHFQHQVFFPSDFSPNHGVPHVPIMYNSPDLLNTHFHEGLLSPYAPQFVTCASPCM